MFHLTVQQGAEKGATWYLVEGEHRLGRNSDCAVTVTGDKAVSRVHCILIGDGDTLTVRQLSDRSTTLLNGAVVTEATVRAGDTLTVGFTTLLVNRAASATPEPSPGEQLLETQTVSSADALYLAGADAVGTLVHQVDSVRDLAELFRIAHRITETRKGEELETAAVEEIEKRFAPRALWVFRLDTLTDEFRPTPGSAEMDNTHFSDALAAVHEAVSTGSGAFIPSRISIDGKRQLRTLMVAPLTAGPVGNADDYRVEAMRATAVFSSHCTVYEPVVPAAPSTTTLYVPAGAADGVCHQAVP